MEKFQVIICSIPADNFYEAYRINAVFAKRCAALARS